jgi:hypothetical protein
MLFNMKQRGKYFLTAGKLSGLPEPSAVAGHGGSDLGERESSDPFTPCLSLKAS